MIHLFSFFSGIGLLDLGFEKEGYKIVYVNESHEPFLNAYKYSRNKLDISPPEYGYFLGKIEDLLEGENKIKLTNWISKSRNADNTIGFIGGPPCPDFSVGGKNKGKHGENGRLSLTYVKLICQQQPDFFLFENVKGLWRTKKHRVFYEELKDLLQNSGYIITEQLINTIEYGVPQDRERIFLFGVNYNFAKELGLAIDDKKKMVLDGAFPWRKYAEFPDRIAFQYSWPKKSTFREDSVLVKPNKIPIELTVEYWFKKNDVLNHPNSIHYFKPRAGLKRFLTIEEGDDCKKSFKRLHRWRYSPTAAYGNNEVHLNPYKARRLSAAEALAIQSLPKEFELPKEMSLTNMFKAIGNGVPFLTAKMIARTINSVISVEEK